MRADLKHGTIPQLVRDCAKQYPDVEALVQDDVRLMYPQFAQQVQLSARAFMAAGLLRGDRVAMWAPNVHEWVIAALGALTAGGVIVPLNTRFKGEEAAYVLSRSRARFLCCVNGFLGNEYVSMLRAADTPVPDLVDIVVLRGDAPTGTVHWADFLAAANSVSAAEIDERVASISGSDLSDIIFTSGTTGQPKGVMTTHEQSLRVFDDWASIVGLTQGDRYLIVNPFFHTFGYKAGIVASLLKGATMIPEVVFDVPAVLQHVSDEKITMLPGPPTLYLSILNHPDRDKFDLSSLRLAVTGAAAVPVEMIKRMRQELTFKTIVTGYGLTESTGTISMCRPQDDPEIISTTSGRAIHDVEVRIVDDNNQEVSRGTAGEIVARGYNVMSGYFEDPVATAETIDADGWLHTGDIGVMDANGYIDITDRKKDMFIVGGFNAYPAEIENTLLSHIAVAQVAVVGVPDDRQGEVGWAFIVARTGATIDPNGIIAWCRERMANYKVPRQVVAVDALPTNASGKVLKYELRARAKDMQHRH